MDQIQVQVAQLEALEARAAGPLGLLVALVVVPALRRDVQLLAGNARGAQRFADAALVAIGRGGVDVPIARRERLRHRDLGLPRRDLKDAEAQLWNALLGSNRHPGNLVRGRAHALLTAQLCRMRNAGSRDHLMYELGPAALQ